MTAPDLLDSWEASSSKGQISSRVCNPNAYTQGLCSVCVSIFLSKRSSPQHGTVLHRGRFWSQVEEKETRFVAELYPSRQNINMDIFCSVLWLAVFWNLLVCSSVVWICGTVLWNACPCSCHVEIALLVSSLTVWSKGGIPRLRFLIEYGQMRLQESAPKLIPRAAILYQLSSWPFCAICAVWQIWYGVVWCKRQLVQVLEMGRN